jgi:GT2 family glycosyltransferase
MNQTHIIIVNYNTGDWLRRSIDSALAHSSGRVSVVDNASKDTSFENAQQRFANESRIDWIRNYDNRGFAAANNQVLRELQADFAVLLNPDCEINSDTLPVLLKAFDENPDMGLASCRILNEDGSLQPTCRRRFPTPWSALVRLFQLHRLFPNNAAFANFDYGEQIDENTELQFVEAISGAFMMARRSAVEKIGLLDEAYFMHCEDLDWCKRFELEGQKVGFISEVHVIHAKGVSSASRPVSVLWTLHNGMNRFFDKFYRNQYSWPVRALVKIGIVLSCVVRSSLTVLRRLLVSTPK